MSLNVISVVIEPVWVLYLPKNMSVENSPMCTVYDYHNKLLLSIFDAI